RLTYISARRFAGPPAGFEFSSSGAGSVGLPPKFTALTTLPYPCSRRRSYTPPPSRRHRHSLCLGSHPNDFGDQTRNLHGVEAATSFDLINAGTLSPGNRGAIFSAARRVECLRSNIPSAAKSAIQRRS